MKFWFFILIIFSYSAQSQVDITHDIRRIFPNCDIKILPKTEHFQSEYIITINQYLDHTDTTKGTFPQRVFLSHVSYDRPMITLISGYAANYEINELSKKYQANQITLEYRFYGRSREDIIPYEYLSNIQAVEDIHYIIKQLKLLYKRKWLSMGISKGGTTCLAHKAMFPHDVDATIAISAPLLLSTNDKRINKYVDTLGSLKIREKILNFQKTVLSYKNEIESLIKMDFSECSFHRINGYYNALQYAILDFPYIYWQMGHSSALFDNLNYPKEYYKVLTSVVDFSKYCDQQINKNEIAYYQFYTENGFYEHSKSLKKKLGITNHLKPNIDIFLPINKEIKYNPNFIISVYKKLQNYGNKIIIINGEKDPWISTRWKPINNRDNLFISNKELSHNIKISQLDYSKRQLVYQLIKKWIYL